MRRPAALRHPALYDGYVDKLRASYDWLERNLDTDAPLHVGYIALAALSGSSGGGGLGIVDDPTSHQGEERAGLADIGGRNREQILR